MYRWKAPLESTTHCPGMELLRSDTYTEPLRVMTVVFDALLGSEADYLSQNSVGRFDIGQPDDFALSNRVERHTLASPDNLRMGRNCCPHRHVVLWTQGSSDDN